MHLHDEFLEAIKLLRSKREMDYELGFEYLGHQGLADEFQDDFLELLHKEDDPKTRARFVEILGYINRDVFELVKQELENPHKCVRDKAEWVLSQFLGYQKRIPEAIKLMKKLGLYVEKQ